MLKFFIDRRFYVCFINVINLHSYMYKQRACGQNFVQTAHVQSILEECITVKLINQTTFLVKFLLHITKVACINGVYNTI
jgi:hypothetical protein